MAVQSRNIRVFLSSPGDVGDERALAIKALDNLPDDPAFRDKITLQIVAWDRPGSGTPMLATMTPQEAINQGLPQPHDCDLVIVIFWSRMGTPLPEEYKKRDGSRYLSGTEWEFVDAVEAAHQSKKQPSRPQVVVYRRSEVPNIALDDPNRDARIQQWERVNAFFGTFTNPDGSIQKGYNNYKSPDDFRAQFEIHLRALITHLLETDESASTSAIASGSSEPAAVPRELWKGSPFPGLRAFTPDDAPIFYGRGAETDALIEKMRGSRFVAVVGASGSGKSSLVGAGLLPRLRDNAMVGSKDWLLPGQSGDADNRSWVGLRFTPGEVGADPFMALAVKLGPLVGRIPRELAADLSAHPETIADFADQLTSGRPDWAEALLFIDQFEELFTLADASAREPFTRLLTTIAQSSRLRVVVTLRADFYARCVELSALAELLKSGTFPLAAPSPDELYEMISRPADRAGLSFEKGLVSQILRDTGDDPGALALLAYALDELYRGAVEVDAGRTTDTRILTFAAYQALGEVQGAIGKRAEHVFNALDGEAQAALSDVFREMIEVDARGEPTRRRALFTLVERNPPMHRLIAAFTDARLLVQNSGENDQPVVEVAHEALLRQWPRLQEWIVSQESDLRLRQQIEQSARDWTQSGHQTDYLLVGGRLEEAQRWQTRFPAGDAAQLYITASADQQAKVIAQEVQRKQELADVARRAEAAQQAAEQAINQAQQSQNAASEAEQAAQKAQQSALQQQQRARSSRRLAGIVGVVAVGIVLLAAISVLVAQSAASQADHQVQAGSTQIAGAYATGTQSAKTNELSRLASSAQTVWTFTSQGIEQRAIPAMLLGIRALRNGYSEQADNILQQILNTPGYVDYSRQFSGQTAAVLHVEISPDGKNLLTTSTNGIAQLWDASTGVLIRLYSGHTGAVTSAVFSPDSAFVMTGSADMTARLWNIASGQVVLTLAGHTDTVTSVAYSPDGKKILTGSADKTARLWDAATGQPLLTFTGHTDAINSVAYAPNGRTVLTGSADRTVRLWDVTTGQALRIFNGHSDSVTSVAFAPDGLTIVAGSADNTATLFDLVAGQTRQIFGGHTDVVTGVAFSPDGKTILTTSADKTARLWNVNSGQTILAFNGHTDTVTSGVFSPDGKAVLTGSADTTAREWDVSTGKPVQSFGGVTSLVFAPDGKTVLIGSPDGVARLWDVATAKPVLSFSGHTSAIWSVAFSPDNKTVLTGSEDNTARLWDIATGKTIQTLSGHTNGVYAVAFAPDGKTILTGSADSTARLWDAATGQTIQTFTGHTAAVYAVAFAPDGKTILTGSADNTAQLWDVATGKLTQTLRGHSNGVDAVAFAPDGQTVLTGSDDKTARMWRVRDGTAVLTLAEHTDTVTTVAYSPDGRYLLTGSYDRTARLWDATSGQRLRVFNNDVGHVNGVTFAPNGKTILVGSDDRARLWNTEYTDFVAYICTRLSRDFTTAERQQFAIGNDYTCGQPPIIATMSPIPNVTLALSAVPTITVTAAGSNSTIVSTGAAGTVTAAGPTGTVTSPVSTITAAVAACNLPPQLAPGMNGDAITDQYRLDIRVHSTPVLESSNLTGDLLRPGTAFTVVAGPEVDTAHSNACFYNIKTIDGAITGWIVQGGAGEVPIRYYIEPSK